MLDLAWSHGYIAIAGRLEDTARLLSRACQDSTSLLVRSPYRLSVSGPITRGPQLARDPRPVDVPNEDTTFAGWRTLCGAQYLAIHWKQRNLVECAPFLRQKTNLVGQRAGDAVCGDSQHERD